MDSFTEKSGTGDTLSCPSYVAKPGAELFGIVGGDGKVNYLSETIRIDKTFVDEAEKGRPADERFRFSGKCIRHGCHQWEEGKCGLIAKIIQVSQNTPVTPVPHCAIRNSCRWYAQEKDLACANCSDVFRNTETLFFQTA